MYLVQSAGELNAVFISGVGVTSLSTVSVTKHHADKVRRKPQCVCICALLNTCMHPGDGVGSGSRAAGVLIGRKEIP